MPKPKNVKNEVFPIINGNVNVFNQEYLKVKSFDNSSEEGKISYAQIELMIKKLNNKEDEMLHSVY